MSSQSSDHSGERSSSDVPSSTSLSLIERLKDDDADAWRCFVKVYGPLVYQWCRKSGLQASDAHDVLQDVLRSVLNNIQAFRRDRAGDSLRGWLWTITRNKLRDQIRGIASRPQAVGGTDAHHQLEQIPEVPSEDCDVEGSEGTNLLIHRTMQLIRQEFEDRTWQAFWRSSVECQTAAEIAQDLRLSKGAVRQAKYRVLKRLRQQLDELT